VGGRTVHVKRRKRVRHCTPHDEGLAILWARERDLPVPELAFIGADREHGSVAGTLDLSPARPLDDLLREDAIPLDARRRVCRDLADAVARLHEARGHHRDLYLNHVFVDPEAEVPIAGIVDWERTGTHRRRLGRWVVKDLAALFSSMPDGSVASVEQARFFVRYLRARGLEIGRAARKLTRRVARRATRMRAHVPRTPVGDAARPKDAAP
jgi:hypothetical protein